LIKVFYLLICVFFRDVGLLHVNAEAVASRRLISSNRPMLIFQLDSDLVHDSTPRDTWLSHRASGRSTALILTQYKIWVVMLQRVYPTSMNCDTVS